MHQRTPAERTRQPILRRVGGGVFVLLVVMLPALLAFAAIDAPVTEAEVERVGQGLDPASPLNDLARMFYGATLPDDAAARWPRERDSLVVAARLAGMLALLAISGLIYLLLAPVRGRATGVVACFGFGLLGPVLQVGHVLRPEQVATMFGLLGVVLLSGLPSMLRRRGPRIARHGQVLCLEVLVGILFGFAMAAHDAAWIYLTIPVGALLLSVSALAFLFPRATRGVALSHWPLRAAARRYVPWMGMVLIGSAMCALILTQAGGLPDRGKVTGVGLLPPSWWLRAPVFVVAAVGVARMGYGVSLRLQRLRRVRPDTVVFVFVAALMVQWVLDGGSHDQLPAATALACLLGDGAMTIVVLLVGRLGRRG